MAISARALVHGFRAIVGLDHARDDAAAREAAAVDGVVPQVIVAPRSTGEVASAIALAAAEGLAVVPRGSGSAMGQGHAPARADVVLDLTRLDRILEYNPDDLTITLEAGVTGSTLDATLAAPRQWLPVDPPGVATRTVGGLAASNASGPLRARYGTLRDLLLGVRFVQSDGVATWGGSKVVKSVTGYDVPKLMVGSLGTLGVLTELTLRLHARPETERTTLIGLPDARAAQALVTAVLDSALQPTRFEVFDATVLGALGAPSAAAGVGVAIAFGSVEAAVAAQEAELAGLARGVGGTTLASSPSLWSRYAGQWQGAPAATLLTVGSLPARVGETLAAVAQVVDAFPTASLTCGGCAVVGSFRVLVSGGRASVVAEVVGRLRAVVSAWGGTVIVQGAPRDVRASVDPWGPVAADAFALMRAIKDTFDPERRLNPGRFVGGL